jgi:electron transfer flavoprotein beta subunit
MGPAQSEEALREALALGADRALLLSDPALAGADTLATSHVLARAVARMDPFPELVLCGRQTIDSDTGHVGPQIAEELNLPQVCGAAEIHMEEGSLIVKNMEDGVVQTLRVTLPAVITVSGEMPPPPPVTLGRLEKAFSDGEVLRWGLEDLGLAPEEVGFAGSANRVRKLHRPPPKGGGEIFSGSPQRLLEHLLRKLESLSILDEEEEAKDA